MKYDIFLSYAYKDTKWAEKIEKELKSKNLKVWMDKEEVVGEKLTPKTREALAQSKYFVSLYSKGRVESTSGTIKLGAALGLGKKVVPVIKSNIAEDELNKLPVPIRSRREKGSAIQMKNPTQIATNILFKYNTKSE